jgi:20S proteasome alpha/beta subunit
MARVFREQIWISPVTIILSIKVQDGVVMASDSAVLHRGHLYMNADKNIQLVRGLPIGVLISGDGAVGTRALTSVMQDFSIRAALRGASCFIEKDSYTLADVATKLRDFILEASMASLSPIRSTLILSGYSARANLPETWSIRFDGMERIEPELVWGEDEYGLSWEGQAGCINRLLGDLPQAGFNMAEAELAEVALFNHDSGDLSDDSTDSPMLVTPGMPLLDAVEVARFLMDTSLAFERLRADRRLKTIGGPVDLAIITRHDGFRWLQRKRIPTVRRKSAGFKLDFGRRAGLKASLNG